MDRFTAFSSIAALIVLGGTTSARGATITLENVPADNPANYQVTNPASNTIPYDATDGNFANTGASFQGTLSINVTFNNGNPVEIAFQQQFTPAAAGLANSGLRLNIVFNLSNNTGSDWDAFEIRTVDPGPDGGGGHLLRAHFHTQGAVNYTATGLDVTQGIDNRRVIGLGNGRLETGSNLALADVLLHERNLAGQRRTFQIVLTPHLVPEPASITTFALGLGVVLWQARRRRS